MMRVVRKVIEVLVYVNMNAKLYWGTGFFFIIFLTAVFKIVVNKEKNKKECFILNYILGVVIIYFFPVTAWVIIKCIGQTYWRMLWLLPVPIVIAYAVVQVLDYDSCKEMKMAVLVLSVLLLAAGGDYLYTEVNFDYDGNVYGVPQSAIDVCEILSEDMEKQGNKDKYVVASEEFSPWLRVYDPTIRLLYGRAGNVNSKERDCSGAQEIFSMLVMEGELNWRDFVKKLKAENCGYFVCMPGRILDQDVIENGLRVVDWQESYVVLALD